ncbi:hypothetical protein N7492_006721 [Penicillium capsulatum]|uniref:Membrane anchor Opy2 N-terminal domain-containing protein n=1 Tax=Penicillium capsulatum TaxID=69766 RepID=A0A9W9LKZ6_9EURO|nr:hypothetical protein N7492_006721 [Penicillium capsulatum]KAJ6116556.1 hypothetical protein N7512_006281 [Penicillium capsulatum]
MLLDRSDLHALAGFSPSTSLFKRCVKCDDGFPACPTCKSDETCSVTSPSCDQCAQAKCIPNPNASSDPPPKQNNAGAIAGGVVGGVLVLVAILFVIWWFVIRPRRAERAARQEKSNQFSAARSERKSTQSIASTVLTRASNVIQIAYIPGVTNRSPPETPHTLVPPVPPLPGATPDQHFFMPGDLRDSSWTQTTGHQSFSPTLRSSVATTVYRNDAIVSAAPAQQIQRSRANIVSVHNASGENTPTASTPVMITPRDAPAVPAITSSQLAKAEATQDGPSSIVARTVTAKPVMVRGASVKKKDGSSPPREINSPKPATVASGSTGKFDHNTSTFDGNSSDEEDYDETRPSTLSHSSGAKHNAAYTIDDNRSNRSGPFQDQPQSNSVSSAVNHNRSDSAGHRHRHSASSGSTHRTPPPRVQSPFSDANEVK